MLKVWVGSGNPLSSNPKSNSCSKIPPEIINTCYPIVGVTVYGGGVMVIRRESKLQGFYSSRSGREDRKIMKFSAKSMSMLVATVNASKVNLRSILTLTYPSLFPNDGENVKKDLHRFLTWFKRRGETEFLWFLEFQKRGAPHFHILSDIYNITPKMRVEVAENWVGGIARSAWLEWAVATKALMGNCECEYKILSDEISKAFKFTLRQETWEILRDETAGKKYATKYATKEYQKEVPSQYKNVGRFWGCSRGVKLSGGVYIEKTEKEVREFLAQNKHCANNWEVLPKYLFNVVDIG